MEESAQDRAGWRRVVCGLCSTGSDKASEEEEEMLVMTKYQLTHTGATLHICMHAHCRINITETE